ncbi:MAG: hypothetical protein Q8R37_05535 [Nanoarchaeota archaeon]|nr:hypothetical protein [Nanoarchaeota archaeon]
MISLVVTMLIAAYSWRIYRINQENKFAYLSVAFILLSLGLLFKTFTGSVLYFTPVRDTIADVLRPVAGKGLAHSLVYYRAAFFLQMASMLSGWLLIFFISQKSRARLHRFHEVAQMALFVYFVVLISLVSNWRYSVFYTTSAVLLGLITLNYYKNYLNTNRNKKSFLVMFSFLVMLLGHIFLVFVFLSAGFYALGQLINLVGFLLLLYTYHSITRR